VHEGSNLLIALVSAFAGALANATTVIMTIRPQRIVVGCDSLYSSHDFNGTIRSLENGCKIRRVGPYYFVGAGKSGESTKKIFSMDDVVAEAYQPGQTLLETVEKAVPLLEQGFHRFADNYRRNRPKYLRMLMKGRPFILQVAFFGMEGSTARVISYEFIAKWKWRRIVVGVEKRVEYPKEGEPAKRYVVFGQRDAIKEHISQTDPRQLFLPSDAKAIENMITLESEKYPERTGLPCVVLQLDEMGAKWLKSAPFVFEV
jgi:hypothetical protein